MRVIVTGGAGYVGSTLTLLLASAGHRVVAVDSDELRLRRLSSLSHDSIDLRTLALDDLVNAPSVLSDAQAVIHLAGISSDAAAESDPQRTWRVNVDLAIALGEAAKSAGVPKFLLASTVAIYQVPAGHPLEDDVQWESNAPPLPQPIGVYAQSKLSAERALTALATPGFTVMVLRKGSLYGYSPVMRWDLVINRMVLAAWMRRPMILHDFGAIWRPIAHVADAARAYLHLLELSPSTAPASSFNLAERNARLSEVCLEVDRVARHVLGWGITLDYGDSPRPQRTGRVDGTALGALGWQPSRSLRDGVAELLRLLDGRKIDLTGEMVAGRRPSRGRG
ncbi:MAG TPA: NAD-dependent epimerase/dehydratase family protein [bacterium]|jgi:nucleoside-diphosphate-sugar epimerase|nr:NAD-dependent epimerase/dehydratase family protein [bacterium]